MHHIYHTDAYILNSVPSGEAGKNIKLLTKEFGLIRATAQGLRYEKSKLRFAIQDYSKAKVALVRGKNDIWRLTNAQAEKNLFNDLSEDKFKITAKIFKLLERLLTGEEFDEELFQIIDGGINYISQLRFPELGSGSQDSKRDPEMNSGRRWSNTSRQELLDIESIFVLRILNRLGYIGDHKNINFYISDNRWENEVINKMKEERRETLKVINQALKESQL